MTSNIVANKPDLIDRVNVKCKELKKTKQDIADMMGVNRSTVSQYLNRKLGDQQSEQISRLEEWFENWLAEVGEPQSFTLADGESMEAGHTAPFRKRENFETTDFKGVTAICTMCQEMHRLGLVFGKTGYGKTYALRNYAKLPRVAYLECNDIMNGKDIVRRLEHAIGMPKGTGSVDERIENLTSFLLANKGYLLIIDEADKLLNKYTTQKIEMFRTITDATVGSTGIVFAGEPSLKAKLTSYDIRLANRMGNEYELKGLTRSEVERYFEGCEVEEEAFEELCRRAYNRKTGCFRLLDRTLDNVMHILKITGKNVLTYDVLKEASNMMVL
ncbi:MAG: AAA family ATPase [Lachnospiraceae bacterium]|nr:AAA family ATPase [Lachnospiraceae bacterium]